MSRRTQIPEEESSDLISFEPDTLFNFEIDDTPSNDSPSVQDDSTQLIVQGVFQDLPTENQPADEDFNGDTELILLTKNDLVRLFNFFDANDENLERIISNALHTGISRDVITSAITRWYKDYNNPQELIEYCHANYQKVQSNQWLFEILNHLPTNQRNYILETYMNNTVNDSVNREKFHMRYEYPCIVGKCTTMQHHCTQQQGGN